MEAVSETSYLLPLSCVDHNDGASFRLTDSLAELILPYDEWIALGRPGRIVFTPRAVAP